MKDERLSVFKIDSEHFRESQEKSIIDLNKPDIYINLNQLKI